MPAAVPSGTNEWEDRIFRAIGFWLAAIIAPVTFISSWVYCVSEYGYLFGFGLGWLPSAILAAIVYLIIRYTWWLFVLGALIARYLS